MRRVFLLALAPAFASALLPWLTVRPVDVVAAPSSPRRFVIADEWGRELTLRGACFENEERSFPPWQRSTSVDDYADGKCPDNVNGYQEPPICGVDAGKGKFAADISACGRNDFAQARALGFNIVRLCLSWSSLEYLPGVYNDSYIDRVAQLVSWAEEQDVYVVLDMHEDLYSLFIQPDANTTGVPGLLTPGGGQDGAPPWAVVTDGWPPLNVFGIGTFNLAIMRSFDNLYNNTIVPGLPQGDAPGPGLQDHYIGALTALARRFVNDSTVAGYEIINEPNPGTTIGPLAFGRDRLYPLYSRVVQAVTGVRDGLPPCPLIYAPDEKCAYPDSGVHDTRHLIFAEPSALRNELDFSAEEVPSPWTTFPNVVHTPHVYTHVFTIDQEVPWLNLTGKWPPSYSFAYDTATAEANRMGAALFVTEFGCGVDSDETRVIPTLDEAERHGVGGTIWSWKSNCGNDPKSPCGNWTWTMYESAVPGVTIGTPIPPNGALYPQRERMMSRVHSRGTLGETLVTFYNISTRAFVLRANVTARAWTALSSRWSVDAAANGTTTDIYIPRSITPSDANALAVDNAVLVDTTSWPDGSRTARFRPKSPGVYTVGVPASSGGPPPDDKSAVAALRLTADALEASAPTLAAQDAAVALARDAEGGGAAIVQSRAAWLAAGAAAAGYPLVAR